MKKVSVLAWGFKAETDALLADSDGKVYVVDQMIREHLGHIVWNEKPSLIWFCGKADRVKGVFGQPACVRGDHLTFAVFGEIEKASVEDVPICILLCSEGCKAERLLEVSLLNFESEALFRRRIGELLVIQRRQFEQIVPSRRLQIASMVMRHLSMSQKALPRQLLFAIRKSLELDPQIADY